MAHTIGHKREVRSGREKEKKEAIFIPCQSCGPPSLAEWGGGKTMAARQLQAKRGKRFGEHFHRGEGGGDGKRRRGAATMPR